MEAFGRIHASQRQYAQWNQMSRHEQVLHIQDNADLHIKVAQRYHHSAILIHPAPWEDGAILDMLKAIRDQSGDEYFIMMHGDPTFDIPRGDNMMEFSAMLYEEPEEMHRRAPCASG